MLDEKELLFQHALLQFLLILNQLQSLPLSLLLVLFKLALDVDVLIEPLLSLKGRRPEVAVKVGLQIAMPGLQQFILE